jgi:hypothetical protein
MHLHAATATYVISTLKQFYEAFVSESILSMDIPSTGPTSLRSNCTDPDTEEDSSGEDIKADDNENGSSLKSSRCKKGGNKDTFALLTSKEELAQAKLILVNDRAA